MDLTEILEFYKTNELVDSASLEYRMLNLLQEIQLWQELSDKEKQSKRRKELVFYQQKFSRDKDYKSIIIYEEKVIELIDFILCFLANCSSIFNKETNLDNLSNQELCLFRLRNMLACEKEMVNRLPQIRHIGHLSFDIVKPLFNQLVDSHFYQLYNLGRIEKLYQEISLMLPRANIY